MLTIGGLQKCTLIDFPGKIAAIVFTQGCNLKCQYCHNPSLLPLIKNTGIDWEDVLQFLQSRKGMLDGVVFTGGEPLLQLELEKAIHQVKDLGFSVKLDTNGTFPEILDHLIYSGTLDYLALDFKSDQSLWETITGDKIQYSNVLTSLNLLTESPVDFEIRMTLIPGIHSHHHLQNMADALKSAVTNKLCFQTMSGNKTLSSSFSHRPGFTYQELLKIKQTYFKAHTNFDIKSSN